VLGYVTCAGLLDCDRKRFGTRKSVRQETRHIRSKKVARTATMASASANTAALPLSSSTEASTSTSTSTYKLHLHPLPPSSQLPSSEIMSFFKRFGTPLSFDRPGLDGFGEERAFGYLGIDFGEKGEKGLTRCE